MSRTIRSFWSSLPEVGHLIDIELSAVFMNRSALDWQCRLQVRHVSHLPTRAALIGRFVILLSAGVLSAGMSLCGGAAAAGRSQAPNAMAPGVYAPAPTIESVSEEAQQEIRACPDSVAMSCVATALTRYVDALRMVNMAAQSEPRANRSRCHVASGRHCSGH